jgi:putative nucleotidyltransferase with HDIG domain
VPGRTALGVALWGLALILMGTADPAMVREAALPEIASRALMVLVGLVMGCGLLRVLTPALLQRPASLLLLILLSLTTLLPASAALRTASALDGVQAAFTGAMMPLALAPMLGTMLLGQAAGFALGLWVSLAVWAFSGWDQAVLAMGLLSSLVAVSGSGRIRKRSQILKLGLAAGLAQTIGVSGVAILQRQPLPSLGASYAGCLAGGLAATVLALLLLPPFESAFDLTTDVTLLELSDLGHPLLQRLAIEAPGTYHHSLVVASLAQAAADEIQANSLLARVCAYYHDIGKLTKPHLYTENLDGQPNPHDELSPHMSALLVTSHVKEGIGLAALHRLPRPILDAIQQHHGTGVVAYFQHKAREQVRQQSSERPEGWTTVDEAGFRYPGPRPVSRESAIVGLADAVEAAARSLERTTAGHIQSLVNRIVLHRLEDGQLDMCEISLAELSRVKRSFVFTLASMRHGRIAYPRDEPPNPDRPVSPSGTKG